MFVAVKVRMRTPTYPSQMPIRLRALARVWTKNTFRKFSKSRAGSGSLAGALDPAELYGSSSAKHIAADTGTLPQARTHTHTNTQTSGELFQTGAQLVPCGYDGALYCAHVHMRLWCGVVHTGSVTAPDEVRFLEGGRKHDGTGHWQQETRGAKYEAAFWAGGVNPC